MSQVKRQLLPTALAGVRGSVQFPLLPENCEAKAVVFSSGSGAVVMFPFTAALGTSHLIRKLGTLEKTCAWGSSAPETVLVVRGASGDLLSAARAAGTVPDDPDAVLAWLDALKYLCCSTPETGLSALVCSRGLKRHLVPGALCASAEPGLRARSDGMLQRRELSDAVDLLTTMPREVRDLILGAGFDDYPVHGSAIPGKDSKRKAEQPDQVQRSRAAFCAPLPPNLSLALLRLIGEVLLCEDDNANMPSTGLGGEIEALTRLLCYTLEGCLCILQHVLPPLRNWCSPHGLQETASNALRTLYERECSWEFGEEGPFVPLSCVGILRRLWEDRPRISPHLFLLLPVLRPVLSRSYIMQPTIEAGCCPLPLSLEPADDPESVRLELLRRVPWLRELGSAVDQARAPDFFVTGSLLTEAIVRPQLDLPGLVGDVDIFCTDDRDLDSLAAVACSCVPGFSRMSKVSTRRWRVHSSDDKPTSKVDVYVNTLSNVRKYYFPHLRAAYKWGERRLYIHPSAALALATGINIDMSYEVFSSKNLLNLMEKKWRAGFSPLLNSREYAQFNEFLFNTARSIPERDAARQSFSTGWSRRWTSVVPPKLW